MKMNKKYITLFFAAVMLTVCSCKNSFQTKPEIIPEEQDMGIINVSASTKNARSISPSADELNVANLTNIKLEGNWQGETDPQEIFTKSTWSDFQSNSSAAVQTGNWIFTLTAQLNGVKFSATQGTATAPVTIVKDTVTNLSFELQSTGEYGGLSITINLTQGSATKVFATLKRTSDNVEADSRTITLPVTNPATFPVTAQYKIDIEKTNGVPTDGIEPGEYKLELAFKTDDSAHPVLNTWKGIVRITAGITTTATISWATEQVYEIQYNTNGGSIVDAVYPLTFTRRSEEITLPTATKIITGQDPDPDKAFYFEGWYTDSSFPVAAKVTKIAAGTVGDLPLYARFIDTLYVNYDGANYAPNYSDGTRPETGFALIDDAIKKIVNAGCDTSNIDWTIWVTGTVGFDDDSQIIPASFTTAHAKSLAIKGDPDATGPYARGTITGCESVTALMIQTSVPVIIQDITIYQGHGENGGGIFIDNNANVTIGSGTEIVENEARYGAGIYSQGNLTFTGGTFSQNNLLSGGGIGKDVYLAKNSSDVQTAITIGAESLGTGFSPTIGLAECTEGFQILLSSDTTYIALASLKFTIQNEGWQSITTDGKIKMKPIVATVNGTPYYTQSAAYNAIKTAEGTKVPIILGPGCTASILGNSSTSSTIAKGIYQSAATSIVLSVESGVTITLNDEDSTGLFQNCKLFSADLRGFNTSNVTTFDYMFANCTGLTELDLTTFTNDSAASAISMFEGCSSLVTIWATDDFRLSGKLTYNTTGADMFKDCTSIRGGVGWLYQSSSTYISSFSAQLGGPNSTGYFTSRDFYLYGTDTTGASTLGSTSLGNISSENGGASDKAFIFKPSRTVSVNGSDSTIYGGINTIKIKLCHGYGDFEVNTDNLDSDLFTVSSITETNASTNIDKSFTITLNSANAIDAIIPDEGITCHITVTDSVTENEQDCYFKLVKSGLGTKESPDTVGDIVFADGTATPYASGLAFDRYQEYYAVAVIFYKGTGLNNSGESGSRMLGAGLVHTTQSKKWCTTDAKANGKNITTINCEPGEDNSFTGGVKNGKNNLQLIGTYLTDNGYEDDTETALSEYPPFEFAKNYKENQYSHVSGTPYSDNWYLPSVAELYEMSKIITTINDVAYNLCDHRGSTFSASDYFWSSTQYNGSNAYYLRGGAPSYTPKSQYDIAYGTAIREF